MKDRISTAIVCVLVAVFSTSCAPYDRQDNGTDTASNKGAMMNTTRYQIGRFSLSIPSNMPIDGHSLRLRDIDITEFIWGTSPKEEQRNLIWKDHLSELSRLRKPEGVKRTVVEEIDISTSKQWARGGYYYGNHAQNDEGFWDILIDAGDVGVWLKYNGIFDAKGEMLELILRVARQYESFNKRKIEITSPGTFFCTRYGSINLPYEDQESLYIRFENKSSELKLEVEMSDTYKDELKEEGLLARTAAAIATGYTSGVDIKQIRSGNREIAGLKGEEQVVRMKSRDESEYDFTWRFAGKKDSGDFPQITISMEAPDGRLEEKLIVWDEVLNSMRPLYVKPR